MSAAEARVELWIDDHLVYEPGVVLGYLRHARVPLDPQRDDAPLVLAEVLSRFTAGELRLRLFPGKPESHPEFHSRRVPTVA